MYNKHETNDAELTEMGRLLGLYFNLACLFLHESANQTVWTVAKAVEGPEWRTTLGSALSVVLGNVDIVQQMDREKAQLKREPTNKYYRDKVRCKVHSLSRRQNGETLALLAYPKTSISPSHRIPGLERTSTEALEGITGVLPIDIHLTCIPLEYPADGTIDDDLDMVDDWPVTFNDVVESTERTQHSLVLRNERTTHWRCSLERTDNSLAVLTGTNGQLTGECVELKKKAQDLVFAPASNLVDDVLLEAGYHPGLPEANRPKTRMRSGKPGPRDLMNFEPDQQFVPDDFLLKEILVDGRAGTDGNDEEVSLTFHILEMTEENRQHPAFSGLGTIKVLKMVNPSVRPHSTCDCEEAVAFHVDSLQQFLRSTWPNTAASVRTAIRKHGECRSFKTTFAKDDHSSGSRVLTAASNNSTATHFPYRQYAAGKVMVDGLPDNVSISHLASLGRKSLQSILESFNIDTSWETAAQTRAAWRSHINKGATLYEQTTTAEAMRKRTDTEGKAIYDDITTLRLFLGAEANNQSETRNADTSYRPPTASAGCCHASYAPYLSKLTCIAVFLEVNAATRRSSADSACTQRSASPAPLPPPSSRAVIAAPSPNVFIGTRHPSVREAWKSYKLDLVNYQDKCRLIRGWDDLFNKVFTSACLRWAQPPVRTSTRHGAFGISTNADTTQWAWFLDGASQTVEDEPMSDSQMQSDVAAQTHQTVEDEPMSDSQMQSDVAAQTHQTVEDEPMSDSQMQSDVAAQTHQTVEDEPMSDSQMQSDVAAQTHQTVEDEPMSDSQMQSDVAAQAQTRPAGPDTPLDLRLKRPAGATWATPGPPPTKRGKFGKN
ncbi:hypothetical protein Bbelb_243340 [Branchiostoma belcheri]|nr:hypothetical protein Bbelb_243340 [Branchiostoma belcheri]